MIPDLGIIPYTSVVFVRVANTGLTREIAVLSSRWRLKLPKNNNSGHAAANYTHYYTFSVKLTRFE